MPIINKLKRMNKLLPLLLLLLSTQVFAQDLDNNQLSESDKAFEQEIFRANHIPQLLQVADGTLKKDELKRHLIVWQRIAQLQPNNPEFQFELARAFALLDEKTGAYNALVKLQNAGLSYQIEGDETFEKIQGTKVYDYIVNGMKDNATAYGEGQVVATVDDSFAGMLFENMVYDEDNNRFLLASIRSGEIYQIDENDDFSPFISDANTENGPWGAVDMVMSQDKKSLWVASASMPQYNGVSEQNLGSAMISQYRLSDGEAIKRFTLDDLKAPKLITALHVGHNDSLYFLSLFEQTIYQLKPDSDKPEKVIELPGLTSIKAITSNADDSYLYVADFEKGLHVIDVANQKVGNMDPKGERFFTGISDLFYVDGDLIGIQSGVSPARVMRFNLAQGLMVKMNFPLEASHDAFATLGNGTVVGDSVYYVANSQWGKMDMGGNLIDGEQWQSLKIIQSPIDFRMQEHIDNQKRIEEIKKKRGIK
jgi:sugar lactone lactonase YvrE